MPPVLLPLSALRTHRACDLDKRIADFTSFHGCAPDEQATLRQWAEVTPAVADLLWATRCLLPEARKHLATGVALRAARRVLPIFEAKYPDDPRPRVALELAEKWLADPTSVSKEELRAAAAATYAATYAAARAAYAAAYAADAAYAAADAAHAAAAADAARAAVYAAAAAAAERAQQRVDFLDILTTLES